MSRPPSCSTSNMALMIWLRTRSFRERRGREETIQSTCRSLGRQSASQRASASRIASCGKRSRNRLTITGDCSTTTRRRGAMPASSNCRVTVPVPAPSSTTSPSPLRGAKAAMLRARGIPLGHTMPTLRGERTHARTNAEEVSIHWRNDRKAGIGKNMQQTSRCVIAWYL